MGGDLALIDELEDEANGLAGGLIVDYTLRDSAGL